MNISIGSSTVNDIRTDQGFKFLPPLHQPNLTDMQIQKILNFCYSILIHRHELPYIGFSDESCFSLGGDKRWLWRMRKNFNPNTVVPQIKFPPSIMIWGMVSMNYKSSLFIFEENENSKNYTEMLNEKFFILDALTYFENDFAFQQDGAPSHTANYTMENLQKLCDIIVNRPPNSPDLKIIEMIRSLMEDHITFYNPTNINELIDAVKQSWNAISFEIINKLYSSFIRSCYLCLENHGKCINLLLNKKNDPNVTDQEVNDLFTKLSNDGIVLQEIEILRKKIG